MHSIQPNYEAAAGCELTEHPAQLPLPHDILAGCGAKAMAMAAELHTQGVDLSDLGIVSSYIPDSSASGLQQAYAA
jgi:hypothetical protein